MLRVSLNKSWQQYLSFTATHLPSQKSSKEEQNIPDTAGEVKTKSLVRFSYGPLRGNLPPISKSIQSDEQDMRNTAVEVRMNS